MLVTRAMPGSDPEGSTVPQHEPHVRHQTASSLQEHGFKAAPWLLKRLRGMAAADLL